MNSSQSLQLSKTRKNQLKIQLGNQENQPLLDEHSRVYSKSVKHSTIYYISTLAVHVTNIIKEHICEVSFDKNSFAHHRQNLLFLIISICDSKNGIVLRRVNGSTHDVSFHEKIEFPIVYNPNPVGRLHEKPFWITGMGLYLDELGRLSLNMSTASNMDFNYRELNTKFLKNNDHRQTSAHHPQN